MDTYNAYKDIFGANDSTAPQIGADLILLEKLLDGKVKLDTDLCKAIDNSVEKGLTPNPDLTIDKQAIEDTDQFNNLLTKDIVDLLTYSIINDNKEIINPNLEVYRLYFITKHSVIQYNKYIEKIALIKEKSFGDIAINLDYQDIYYKGNDLINESRKKIKEGLDMFIKGNEELKCVNELTGEDKTKQKKELGRLLSNIGFALRGIDMLQTKEGIETFLKNQNAEKKLNQTQK